MRHSTAPVAILALATLFPVVGFAQSQETSEQSQGASSANQGAQQCRQALDAFAQRMNEDQFWVTGWGSSWGYGAGGRPTATPPADSTATGTPLAPADPWSNAGGVRYGIHSPRNQIEVLYGAAHVLADQNKEEGCEYVLAELSTTYDQYTERLQEAGIDPAQVTSWRQEQILAARPVEELQRVSRFTVDDITGTDVRNLQDQNLGSVSDVVLDLESDRINYAIVARGGFLGIGRDHVAVPWNRFRAAPGLNTLVLDVSEQALANAPSVDPDTFGDPNSIAQQNDRVNQYWEQQASR